jgi:hypothetical protein
VCHICTEPIDVDFENDEVVLVKCKKVAVKSEAEDKIVHAECFDAVSKHHQQ